MNEENSESIQVVQFNNINLLRLGIPNKNGIVYTKECIENAIKNIDTDEKRVIVHNVYDKDPLPVGLAENFRIEKDFLVCDCIFSPLFIKTIEGQEINVRPIGQGNITEDKQLKDYLINGFTVVYKPSDSISE